MDNSIKIADHFSFLIDELKQHGKETTRTIIYCQTIKQCAILFNIFKVELGSNMFCDGTNNPRMRLCDMMHSSSPESIKNHVLEQFSNSKGHLRVLIATIAYGMGVNCRNVQRVIHFGPSKSVESYMQESGRCGRNGEQSIAILLFNGITTRVSDNDIKQYIHSNNCRRQFLLQHFNSPVGSEMPQGHMCCDMCANNCMCNDGSCNVDLYLPFGTQNKKTDKVRDVSNEEKKELRLKLNMLMKQLLMKSITGKIAISCPISVMEFGVKEIDQVVEYAHLICNTNDVMRYVDIWKKKHALLVMEVFSSIFHDIVLTREDDQSDDEDSDEDEITDWEQIIQDSSFLCLMNETDWQVESFEESVIENIHESN